MIQKLLFYLVVLLTNAVQTATGFGGTVIAMAPSLKLLGADVAKPLLSALSFLVGAAVTLRARKHIDWRVFSRIAVCMVAGLFLGMALMRWISFESFLPFYGVFLIAYALYRLISRKESKSVPLWAGVLIMLAAGVLQTLFLSGGALLVIYASAVLPDKERFRATISPVWVLLNAILLVQYVQKGMFTPEVLGIGAVSLLPLALGILLGNWLHGKISQKLFMTICFLLLLINGVWILLG